MMRRLRMPAPIASLLLLLAACGEAVDPATEIPVVRVAPEIGSRAPDFTLRSHDGRAIALSSFRGRVVLIDFWATWCEPCIADLPSMKARWERYRDSSFALVGVTLDTDLDAWRRFVADQQLGWTNLGDGGGWNTRPAIDYRVDAIPASFLLDREGTIVAINARGRDLDSAIVRALRR